MARVLLVDDDAGVLETCGAFLRLAGLDVQTAACGRTALEALGRGRFDLLFLDLRLPDSSGLDVLAEVRRCGSAVPVIIMTGHPTLESSVRALRLGAMDFLSKPVDGDVLVAATGRALARATREGTAASIVDSTNPTSATADDEALEAGVVAEEDLAAADGLALWVTAMCRLVKSPKDVSSIGRWALLVGISERTLRRWCRVAGVDPKASLDLARVLRAIRCAHDQRSVPARFLGVGDPHTAERLLMQGGVGPVQVPAVEDALARQTLVPDALAIRMLRARLGEAGPTSGPR